MLTMIHMPMQRLRESLRRILRHDDDAPLHARPPMAVPRHAPPRERPAHAPEHGARGPAAPDMAKVMLEQDQRRLRIAERASATLRLARTRSPAGSSRHSHVIARVGGASAPLALARASTTSVVGCAACGHPLCRLADVIDGARVAAHLRLDDSDECVCTHSTCGALPPAARRIRMLHANDDEHFGWAYAVCSLHCPGCTLFIGVRVLRAHRLRCQPGVLDPRLCAVLARLLSLSRGALISRPRDTFLAARPPPRAPPRRRPQLANGRGSRGSRGGHDELAHARADDDDERAQPLSAPSRSSCRASVPSSPSCTSSSEPASPPSEGQLAAPARTGAATGAGSARALWQPASPSACAAHGNSPTFAAPVCAGGLPLSARPAFSSARSFSPSPALPPAQPAGEAARGAADAGVADGARFVRGWTAPPPPSRAPRAAPLPDVPLARAARALPDPPAERVERALALPVADGGALGGGAARAGPATPQPSLADLLRADAAELGDTAGSIDAAIAAAVASAAPVNARRPGLLASLSALSALSLPIEQTFIGLRYTRVLAASAHRCASTQLDALCCSVPLLCARCLRDGVRSVLSYTDQLLCTHRRWAVGGGPSEPACYVNSVVARSVRVKPAYEEQLAQGLFDMADVHCAACGEQVGYAFVADKTPRRRNENQVGRFGLVTSRFVVADYKARVVAAREPPLVSLGADGGVLPEPQPARCRAEVAARSA